MSTELNAVVTRRTEVAPGLAIFRVEPVGWEIKEFTPGQFAVLGLPGSSPRASDEPEDEAAPPDKMIRRAYSIASSPLRSDHLEFYVVLVPTGALTPRLFALDVGDELWLGTKITGNFTLEEAPEDKNVMLVSTGTGLAPYISMMRTVLPRDRKRHYGILHGARHSVDLGYREELIKLDRENPNFTYVPSISRPKDEPEPWEGESGYIQDIWSRKPFDASLPAPISPENTHVFLCGNPAMIETMVEQLGQSGFVEHSKKAPGQIHVERYW